MYRLLPSPISYLATIMVTGPLALPDAGDLPVLAAAGFVAFVAAALAGALTADAGLTGAAGTDAGAAGFSATLAAGAGVGAGAAGFSATLAAGAGLVSAGLAATTAGFEGSTVAACLESSLTGALVGSFFFAMIQSSDLLSKVRDAAWILSLSARFKSNLMESSPSLTRSPSQERPKSLSQPHI